MAKAGCTPPKGKAAKMPSKQMQRMMEQQEGEPMMPMGKPMMKPKGAKKR